MTTKPVNIIKCTPNSPVSGGAKTPPEIEEVLEELDLQQDDSVRLALGLMRKNNLEPAAQAILRALPPRANASRQDVATFRTTVKGVAAALRGKYVLSAGNQE